MTKPRVGAHAHIPASAIAARLAERAEDLCHELLPKGRREGSEWRCGSVQGEAGKSLGVHLNGAKIGIWADFATGQSGDLLDLIKACLGIDTAGAIGWAKNWLGIDDGARAPAPRPRPAPKSERQDEGAAKRTEAALVIWRASQPASGTPVETYLHGRHIVISIPPSIRFHSNLKHGPTGLNFETMVASAQRPDGRITGVHRTFLLPGGRGKAEVNKPKMALGSLGNGAVRLGPARPALGIAEGIETALSASQLFDIPVWAALSVGRLPSVWLPPDVLEVQVFGDNGERGHEGAEKARQAFNEQGRRVVLRFPPERFGDWNDFLRDQKPEASA